MIDVFISYSHSDQEVALDICKILDDYSIPYFRDERSIEWGDRISDQVKLALAEAVAVLVVISPGSLKSQWVAYEVGYASALEKKVLPFLTHPELDVPGYVGDLKYYVEIKDVRDYFSNSFESDRRFIPSPKDPERSDIRVDSFRKSFELMPNLLKEMKNDFESDETKLIRELIILPKKSVLFSSIKPRFAYFEDEHPNLMNKFDMLEEFGFVYDVTIGNTPIYRTTEEFIEFLKTGDLADQQLTASDQRREST